MDAIILVIGITFLVASGDSFGWGLREKNWFILLHGLAECWFGMYLLNTVLTK